MVKALSHLVGLLAFLVLASCQTAGMSSGLGCPQNFVRVNNSCKSISSLTPWESTVAQSQLETQAANSDAGENGNAEAKKMLTKIQESRTARERLSAQVYEQDSSSKYEPPVTLTQPTVQTQALPSFLRYESYDNFSGLRY